MTDVKHEAPGFMTYREAAIMFSLMPEGDAARAIKATCDYYLYRTLPANLTGTAQQVFKIMKADIDRNNEKYKKIVERNKRNIEKRWEKGGTTGIPVVNKSNTNLKPETLNSKPQSQNRNCEAATPPRAKRFTPPTLAEVQSYVAERQSPVDPQGFIDFYESKGWLVGKTPMKDWKAACRNAEKWERWNRNDSHSRVKTTADYGAEDFFNA